MRTAVFSDVHGNLVALEAFLEDAAAREIDAYVCLGDALQGGPQPRECLDRLDDLGCSVVLGNADAFLLELEGSEPVTASQLDVGRWTQEQLGPEGLERIRGFEASVRLELGAGRSLFAMHGSPTSFDRILLPSTPEDELREALAEAGPDADVVAGGHVHLQWCRPIAHRTLLNPGSVGLAYDHEQAGADGQPRLSAWAEYAVVDSRAAGFAVELHRVTLDRAEVVRSVEASGRPDAAALALAWR